ncbi:MAG: DUF4337 domain-containing protein [Acidobacteriia bacterium]|nr:DUF4337 domain-containing protein [Terriglobia bacterium]
MNIEEIKEGAEHAHEHGEKPLGLTMAVVAVLLAMATLLGHRAHTEEVVLQGERNTQWVNFDTKRMQRTLHEDFAILSASLPGAQEKAAEFKEKARLEREGEPGKDGAPAKEGTDKIRERALELDAEMKLTQRRANYYDGAELFLEISIVLCSIALLAEMKLFWKLSFITTFIGIGIVLWGFLLH